MSDYLYLSLIPESLVTSMLPPEEFGAYLATGTRKRPHGGAMFFEVHPDFQSEFFDLAGARARCVPHDDGRPKHSVYISIYRVLEHVPREVLKSLYLVTTDGRVLELPPGELSADESNGTTYHLYQELAPVRPLIATGLGPNAFCRFITDPAEPIHVPRMCLVELELGGLAADPGGDAFGLPYSNIEHIRDCLRELVPLGPKQIKTINRVGLQRLIYRCVKKGFYVGDQDGVRYYPYPTHEQLEREHYDWWRSATEAELG